MDISQFPKEIQIIITFYCTMNSKQEGVFFEKRSDLVDAWKKKY